MLFFFFILACYPTSIDLDQIAKITQLTGRCLLEKLFPKAYRKQDQIAKTFNNIGNIYQLIESLQNDWKLTLNIESIETLSLIWGKFHLDPILWTNLSDFSRLGINYFMLTNQKSVVANELIFIEEYQKRQGLSPFEVYYLYMFMDTLRRKVPEEFDLMPQSIFKFIASLAIPLDALFNMDGVDSFGFPRNIHSTADAKDRDALLSQVTNYLLKQNFKPTFDKLIAGMNSEDALVESFSFSVALALTNKIEFRTDMINRLSPLASLDAILIKWDSDRKVDKLEIIKLVLCLKSGSLSNEERQISQEIVRHEGNINANVKESLADISEQTSMHELIAGLSSEKSSVASYSYSTLMNYMNDIYFKQELVKHLNPLASLNPILHKWNLKNKADKLSMIKLVLCLKSGTLSPSEVQQILAIFTALNIPFPI